MSWNRIISLLIVLGVLGGGGWLFYSLLVGNVGTITITLKEPKTAHVELTGDFKNYYVQDCTDTCTFSRIPPVSYTLAVTSTGYEKVGQSLRLEKSDDLKFDVVMRPELAFNEIKAETKDKVGEARKRQALLDAYSGRDGADPISLSYSSAGLLFYDPTKREIGIMSEDAPQILVREVEESTVFPLYANKSLIAYRKAGSSYLYDFKKGQEYLYNATKDFPLDVRMIRDSLWIVTTSTGVAQYEPKEERLTPHNLYDDYIPLPSGELIALVKRDSKDKLSLLNIPEPKGSVILRVTKDNRTRTIIAEFAREQPSKLVQLESGKIGLTGAMGTAYEFSNLPEILEKLDAAARERTKEPQAPKPTP